jgi:hypothetical protein
MVGELLEKHTKNSRNVVRRTHFNNFVNKFIITQLEYMNYRLNLSPSIPLAFYKRNNGLNKRLWHSR